MLLIPAIDIRGGKCVRLVKGDFLRETTYSDDPAEMAERWEKLGATLIHVVDLDASRGTGNNREAVKAIRERVGAKIQLGGGLKDISVLDLYADMGIDFLVMGTAVLENPGLVSLASRKHPGKTVAALDSEGDRLKTWGWEKGGEKDLLRTAATLKDLGVGRIIHTDTERDGTLEGPNAELALEVAKASSLPTIVSGGVSGEDDLRVIKTIAPELAGVITGKALYAETLDYRRGKAILENFD
ncbi:MAG: 1-(5-phosphoribosyl)-5-((5-phosphoribosylamino)methylideneamino)imidazole-4-carboxamide isomerase [Deltaproteobacteria bacterium]|jgi:phosphoribosylformimino-5-aminoimidazole carboxamide ribotide isomerase|nr:1-(5-phosphoribosyl)-5-((5-phosphoribosylamino)methylideneamino)imidazole-4-carboxamide isomerase [Deltaproteobacteria bacterium]